MSDPGDRDLSTAVAIVGLAGRFPGARDLAQFWENLRAGVESIAALSEEDLAAAGVPPAMRGDPRYVRAEGSLDGIDLFDARFFGFSPREATLLDPQHRLFFECAWEALGSAGCVPERYRGAIGVFAGTQINGYLLFNLLPNRDALEDTDWLAARFLNDKDFLATRTAYLLDLKGPSLTVQTACSTSLVAVHVACRSLLGYECDMALAGGVSASVPHRAGYRFHDGGILSPDGHCRPFAAEARGTVPGSGVGIVVLKRLEDALAEGDPIRAVVLGTAINNDGAGKVGFTAPSVGAQAEVIAAAQRFAGIDPESISLIEAHGTGTLMGDPIEVAALQQAFGARTRRRGFCALGSVKGNLGHLDAAAGVAGLIKTVLALEHRQIPPTLHAANPSPEIDFAGSAFYLNTALREWTAAGPRRAGVSSFGIGGTNAHAVLEEAPPRQPGSAGRPWQLLPLSARTATALERATAELATHLDAHPELDLADVGYTLQVGRRSFPHRRFAVCRDPGEARRALAGLDPELARSRSEERSGRRVAFLFPGQGAQHPGMGAALYHGEEAFRRTFDECAEILRPHLGLDLRAALLGPPEEAAAHLGRTAIVQPALFVLEYGLARLFMGWGIEPAAMLGHSIGEYVAACLAGVFPLDQALALVAARGRLMQELAPGAMLSCALPEADLLPLLGEELALAAVNAPGLTVASGPEPAVAALAARLAAAGVESRRLATSHAFHSPMMDPALAAFAREAAALRPQPPRIPYLSNLTGTWITPAEATDPDYWVRHLRHTVRFSQGVQELLRRDTDRVLLEVGPGRTLASFVRRQTAPAAAGAPAVTAAPTEGVAGVAGTGGTGGTGGAAVVQALPQRREARPEPAFLLDAVGRLWLAGVEIDWEALHRGERRLRVPLPTHPFERRHFWLEPPHQRETREPSEAKDLHEESAAAPLRPPSRPATTVPRHPRPDLDTAYTVPRDSLEEGLAALWQEVLGIEQVGAHDDFFELGGHSLMATQLISRIRDRYALEIPLDALFENATVAKLAPLLLPGEGGEGAAGAAPAAGLTIPRLPLRQGPLALSFAQQRLWFLDRLEPGSPWYNLAFAVRFAGSLDVAALRRAVDALASRQESLRTTFDPRAGQPAQVIAAPAPLPLPVADLAGLAGEAREAEALRLAGGEARRPFDLARGPLWRVRLLRLGAGDHLALLTLHHIVSDGESMSILVRELGALYEAFATGARDPLPPLLIQYADFAAWQRSVLPAVMETKLLPYWRQRLGGRLPVLELPSDRPRPALQTFRGARSRVALPAALTAGLRALARQHGATLFMTLLAGLDVLLHRYTEETDLLVGSPVANRNHSQIEGLIGLFVNTLVLRTDLAGDPGFVDLLARVRAGTLGAYAHQDLPFERLVEELQPRRDLARSPFFQVMLGLERVAATAWRVPGLAAVPLEVDLGASRFECTFFLAETAGRVGEGGGAGDVGGADDVGGAGAAGGIGGHLEYNRDLFDPETAARLVAHFGNLLGAAAAAPATPISRLSLLAPAEEVQLRVEWNATAREVPRQTAPELILRRIAERPAAVALRWGDERLTYAELGARAGRLASRLRRLGVGPEKLVGIACERSPEMVWGLLGIWLAGGAYLPLDPAYPPERLALMLADSGAAVLLTQERLLSTLPPHAAHVVCLDGLGSEEPGGSKGTGSTEEASRIDGIAGLAAAENLAYVIYTSGSTGRPKGVGVPHGALVNFLAAMCEEPGLTAADRLLAVTSLSFDIAGLELWLPLFAGAEIDLIGREVAADGARLRARLSTAAGEVAHAGGAGTVMLQATPSTWRLLLAAGWRGGEGIKALCGGEALPPALAAEVGARAGALWNVYGPTETTIWSAVHRLDSTAATTAGHGGAVPLGHPIANTTIHLVDPRRSAVPLGVPGELLIGGAGLARGYLGRPYLTAERFVPDPWASAPGARLYRTGDLARRLAGGSLEFLGRIDHQIKVRGFRVEPGEIEAALARHPAVAAAVVTAREPRPGDARLAAYVVPRAGADPAALAAGELRGHLRATLPEHMIPGHFHTLAALPLLPNGKVDRRSLPDPEPSPPAATAGFAAPRGEVERAIAAAWREALGLDRVGIHDNFFDLGGHSLLLSQVHARLRETLDPELPLLDLFKHPTVAALAERLRPGAATAPAGRPGLRRAEIRLAATGSGGANGAHGHGGGVAIVGLAGRFPGAPNVDAFWRNLRQGVESIRFFGDEELLAAGADPELVADPNYVKARAVLDGIELFDAAFFGYTPREAAILDPQQRLFLEVAWEALENAGYDVASWDGAIGVFAGAGMNTYLGHLVSHPGLLASVGGFQAMIGNDKDFLPTRVSYKLNLRGPSLNVQTACSTSLVAVHLACQQLLHGECDLALAGGATVLLPAHGGYLYEEGGILSRDGHCRPFDVDAGGTVGGSGVAAVVLKRLADARDDGDTVYAVIRGSALNNDGSGKVGFTAPSSDGQAAVIAQALAVAGVDPATIGYVETHGTGTALGDPIEVAALEEAFGATAAGARSCGIGAVKSNVGHLDTAAGVAGLIKAVLALHHGEIPPTLHFHAASPRLGLESSPFYVVDRLTDWRPGPLPRRAGVSAFGIGGTNAHVVLEEAPPREPAAASTRPAQLLVVSARSEAALEAATDQLARHLAAAPEPALADVAYTLQVGRKAFPHRRTLLARAPAEAAAALAERDPRRLATAFSESGERPIAFLFPGGGAQHAGMARGLYEAEPVFRRHLDDCLGRLEPRLGFDLRRDLFPTPEHFEAAERRLERTSIALPALFAVEYALAQLWLSFGVRPQAMIGHSLGEYPAACLAGVMSLDDTLDLVVLRGRLFETLPAGVMLSVQRPEAEVLPLLPAGAELSVAAVNSPAFCVLSGSIAAIAQAEEALAARGLDARRLHISVAAHSPMVEPILAEFGAAVARLRLSPPTVPFLSNVTGTWIRDDEATDPGYWVRQLRQTVRFADGLERLLAEPERVLLEVGPGQTLSSLAMQHPAHRPEHMVLGSMRHPQDGRPDADALLDAVGQLWLAGVTIDWRGFSAHERRRRVPLPTYPFERRRHWIELRGAAGAPAAAAATAAMPAKRADIASWFYSPVWRQAVAAGLGGDERLDEGADGSSGTGVELPRRWLLLLDDCGLGAGLAQRLERHGREVVTVTLDGGFERRGERAFGVAPASRDDFAELFRELEAQGRFPDQIVHLWSVTVAGASPAAIPATIPATAPAAAPAAIPENQEAVAAAAGRAALDRGFHSLLAMAQALGQWPTHPVRVAVVSSGVQVVTGGETVLPEKAALLGPVRVAPQEMPHLSWRSIDVDPPPSSLPAGTIDRLLAELAAAGPGVDTALRGTRRWVQDFAPVRLTRREGVAGEGVAGRLRERGVYLITGGLGGVGLEIAAWLARTARARLVLTGRSDFPPRAEWEGLLADYDVVGSGPGPIRTSAATGAHRSVRRIRKLLAIEAVGGEVRVVRADAADLDAMRGALAAARSELGALHGVIHAAGVVAGGMVEWKTREAATAVLAPKLGGTRVLARLLAGVELDFVVLCSAANSILGGFGQVDLCAASAGLDAFAAAWPGPSPCLTIDWDTWQDVGAAVEVEVPPDLAELHREGLRHGMTAAEGVEAFARLLRAGQPRLLVSTRDLPALLARAREHAGEDPLAGLEEARPAVAAQARPALRNAYVAPTGEVEGAVAALWQEMMGLEQVGAHDNFFQLGGHSLLATQIVSRLRDAFAVELPIAGFFEAPTVAGLATLVERQQFLRAGAARTAASGAGANGGDGTGGPEGADLEQRIPALPRDGRLFPLSFAQQRLWFLDRLEPGRPWYNMPLFLSLRGPLALAALRRAFDEIERRHEVLRTSFELDDEQPVQAIAAARGLAPPLADLSGLPAAAAAAEHERLLASEAERPFDLARGPLCRALLLRRGEREHALLLALHHIVCDGWSLGVLVRELGTLYGAFAAGRPSPLPPLPIQYADFAVWQRQALAGEALARQLDYWREQLADSPSLLQLPADRPRPALQSQRGRTLPLPLPDELWNGVQALARRLGATPFVILLAAWKVLLRRLARQPDVVVGTPAANRGRSEIEGLIGFFVNTLVLRTSLAGDPSFEELVARVQRVAAGGYAHQDLPFERLVDELHIERHLGHNPLFQVMFILQSDPLPAAEIAGLSLAPLEVEGRTAKFDLMLQLWQQPAGLTGFLEYNADLFDAATVHRFGEHFETLLAGALDQPRLPLPALPLLAPAARHQVVAEWNDTNATHDTDTGLAPGAAGLAPTARGPRDLFALFATQAERAPDAIALTWEAGCCTYRELGRRAARLACRLRRLGVGPDVPVAICLRRSPEMAVAVLGVLAAGGAYVPLDPAYPRERLARMLQLAATGVLLSQPDLLPSLPAAGITVVFPAAPEPAGAAPDVEPASSVQPDDLAYVIFTSGSTGVPKGVALPHRALVSLFVWQLGQSALAAGAKTLQFASLSFDVSCQELFATWAAGGTLALISEAVRLDAARLLDVLVRDQVERIFLPFVALQQLAETAAERGLHPHALREVVTAGEQLQITGAIAAFFSRLPRARLWNQYGPSESHVATAFALAGPARGWPALPLIGKPVANARIHLLDETARPVPPGVPGELHIGGACLARGYFHRPELTADRFVPDPLGGAGQRLYRTGDLARYRPDGDVEFLGRNDQQVKIRGFRVEPGEIEAALATHPGVREAVVVARAAAVGPRRLVAYVVPAEPAPGAAEIRSWLRDLLPEYMVPAVFQLLDSLPLTPSGKVDRRALPDPDPAAAGPEAAAVPPRTPVEELLAGIWRDLLGIERVGVRDSFFDLGGHSLLAVRLMARIRRQCGRDLPLAVLFAGPTIEGLAALLDPAAAAAPPEHRAPLVELAPGDDSRLPLFLVHPVGGGVLCYAALARALGAADPGQPIFGLQSPDWQGAEPATLEAMAERYVAAVRGHQPCGPYRLGGWSMGGVAAFEMARQLRQAGDKVALLALLDSYAPGEPGGIGSDPLDEAAVRALFARDLSGLMGKELPATASGLDQLGPDVPLAEAFAQAQAAGLLPAELDFAATLGMLAIFRANLVRLQGYAGGFYPGRVTLFRATGAPAPAPGAPPSGPALGWEALAAVVEVEPIPGDHYSLVRPPAVEAIAARLDERRTAAPGAP